MDPLQSALAAPDTAAGTRTAGPREPEARWRLELERAQLARQSRQAAGSAPSAPSAASGRETEAPGRSALPSDLQAQRRSGDRFLSQQHAATSRAVERKSDPVDGVRSTRSANPPGGGEARVSRSEFGRTAAPLPRPAARPVPVTWPKVNVHAQWNGAGVQVWVRDASLDATARERLASRLRTQLRLERLTVNGETIYHEEEIAWPSKQ